MGPSRESLPCGQSGVCRLTPIRTLFCPALPPNHALSVTLVEFAQVVEKEGKI